MGPLQSSSEAADAFAWAHYVSGSCRRCPGMGPFQYSCVSADGFVWAHLNAEVRLPMGSPGPIIILGAAADVLR
jgi:hypothetical protein